MALSPAVLDAAAHGLDVGAVPVQGAAAAAGATTCRIARRTLRYQGPVHMTVQLDARYRASIGGELRAVRTLYFVLSIALSAFGLTGGDSAQLLSYATVGSVGVACLLALRLRPAAAEAVSLAAAALMTVALDIRERALMPSCGGCKDVMTIVGVIPFVTCVVLAPHLAYIAPVLCAQLLTRRTCSSRPREPNLQTGHSRLSPCRSAH